MNLSDQVCSLELSQKLLTFGVNQNSLFYWYHAMHDKVNITWKIVYGTDGLFPDRYAAFTAAEILDMLPHYVDTKTDEPFNNFRISITKAIIVDKEKNQMVINYLINYLCDTTETGGEKAFLTRNLFQHNFYDPNLANAAAKALIYLIESGLVTPLPGVLQDG